MRDIVLASARARDCGMAGSPERLLVYSCGAPCHVVASNSRARRLRFVGNTVEEQAHARELEVEFWDLVQRETRVPRILAALACLVMFAVGCVAWPSQLYVWCTVAAAAALVLLLVFPRRANLIMSTLVLPAGVGERAGPLQASPHRHAVGAFLERPVHNQRARTQLLWTTQSGSTCPRICALTGR